MKLNEENIELYLFRYKEGLLDATETAEVERALASHPEWQELADLYDPELTLPAGATMPYADIDSLRDGGPKAHNEVTPIKLRDNDAPRRRIVPFWTAFAAAACLLLFVTTIVRFLGGSDGQSEAPVLADVVIDDTLNPYQSDADTFASVQSPAATENASSVVRASQYEEPALLAEIEQPELKPASVEEMAVDTNRSKYDLDEPTLREVNDPMDQEVLYANIIDWRTGDSEPTETPSRRQPLRNIARKATSIIATAASGYEESRENVEGAIEERIQSNQFVNSLIATLE